jgi:hypothetical protein
VVAAALAARGLLQLFAGGDGDDAVDQPGVLGPGGVAVTAQRPGGDVDDHRGGAAAVGPPRDGLQVAGVHGGLHGLHVGHVATSS